MGKVASRRPLLHCLNWARGAIAAMLGCCLTCVLLLAGALHALDPNKRLTQYLHTSWRIQDGSAPSGMSAITQTSDGFLWFLSPPGDIYRFDGVRFHPWRLPGDSGSVGKTMNILGDHAGGLWVFGEHEVVHLKGAVVTSRIQLEGVGWTSNAISEDADGSIWLVRANGVGGPLCHVTERAVKCFGEADGIPVLHLNALLPDGNGGFWLGGETTLVHWHAGASEVYPVEGLKSNAGQMGIVSLARDPDGSLWVGIINEGPGLGLAKLEGGTVRSFVTPTFDGSKVNVFPMRLDREGNLWLGTLSSGVLRVHGKVVEHYGRTEGLSSDYVRTLFEDREGIVWAVTNNGIDNFHDPRATTFSALEGLGKDLVVGVLASRDGTIWIANAGSLDHIGKNGDVSSIRTENGLPGTQVTSMLEDRAGNIWVGVDDGLYLFKNGRFRRIPEPNHQALGMVSGITEDIDGNIWAQCSGNSPKLVRIRDFQVQEEFPRSQVPWGEIAADPQGGIWIATRKGDLVLFRQGVQKKFPMNPNGSNPSVHKIVALADGAVLGAFDDGLLELREGKVQRMTTKNGLPCDEIITFIQDKERRWWLYTRCGVVEFADSELQRWWNNPEAVVQTRLFDVLDGARQAGRTIFNAAAISPDGRVWFATGAVVQMVDPSRLSPTPLAAETYIESVIVDRKEFPATENLNLFPHPRDLQIDYTSPTFLIPQRVKFRYRLDGYDRDWQDAGTRRQAFYTNLPPGKYSFRVIACNSDGVWNDSAAKLDFSIAPAYYQTNWFRALCAIFFLVLLWAAYQWRVRQLNHQFEMTLDARVGERTRIARDLHDTLLQSFHGVLLRLQTVSFLLPEGEPKEKLDSTIEQAAEAITEGRDAVQGLRDSTTQTNDLALAISTLGGELAADSTGHRPALRVAVEGQSRDLHPLLRDEVYKIAAEALRNAFPSSRTRIRKRSSS